MIKHNLAALLALGAAAVSAAPNAQPAAPMVTLAPRRIIGVLDPWISVDENLVSVTNTPFISTAAGAVATVLPNPFASSEVPLPKPTDSAGGGTFPACISREVVGAPFCSPRDGSKLTAGERYYVTWDPSYFASEGQFVDVVGAYEDPVSGELTMVGFSNLHQIMARTGFWTWWIDPKIITDKQRSLNVTLSLRDPISETLIGGHVEVMISMDKPAAAGQDNSKVIKIVVPIVVVFVLALGVGLWLWLRRRAKNSAAAVAAASRSRRTFETGGDKLGQGVNIAMKPTSPTSGGNIFREEIERQDRQDRY